MSLIPPMPLKTVRVGNVVVATIPPSRCTQSTAVELTKELLAALATVENSSLVLDFSNVTADDPATLADVSDFCCRLVTLVEKVACFPQLGNRGVLGSRFLRMFPSREEAIASLTPTKLPSRSGRCPFRGCSGELLFGTNSVVCEWECPECRGCIRTFSPPTSPNAGVRTLEFKTAPGEFVRALDRGSFWVLQPQGRLDMYAGERLEKLWLTIPEPRRVLIDLTRATEVSRGGAGILSRLTPSPFLVVLAPNRPVDMSLLPPGVPTRIATNGDDSLLPKRGDEMLDALSIPVTAQVNEPVPSPTALTGEARSPQARKRRLEIEDRNGVTVARFTDKKLHDEQIIQLIAEELFRLVDDLGCQKLILDFSNVEYLSSAAQGKVISLHKKLQKVQGRLVIARMTDAIFEIYHLTKIDQIIAIKPSLDEALGLFTASGTIPAKASEATAEQLELLK